MLKTSTAGVPAPGPEPEEVERLFEELRPFARRVFGYFKIPPADAEDLLQETFLGLLLKWDEVECPPAWLRTVLRRRCQMHHPRQRWTVELDAVPAGLLARQPAQERSERRLDLGRSLDQLIPRQRALLKGLYVLGLSGEEAASRAAYRPCSVSVTRRGAVRKLRAFFEGPGPPAVDGEK